MPYAVGVSEKLMLRMSLITFLAREDMFLLFYWRRLRMNVNGLEG